MLGGLQWMSDREHCPATEWHHLTLIYFGLEDFKFLFSILSRFVKADVMQWLKWWCSLGLLNNRILWIIVLVCQHLLDVANYQGARALQLSKQRAKERSVNFSLIFVIQLQTNKTPAELWAAGARPVNSFRTEGWVVRAQCLQISTRCNTKARVANISSK